jgi:hypothetical protein
MCVRAGQQPDVLKQLLVCANFSIRRGGIRSRDAFEQNRRRKIGSCALALQASGLAASQRKGEHSDEDEN